MTDLIEQLENYAWHFDRAIGHGRLPSGSTGRTIEPDPDEGDVIMLDIKTRPVSTDPSSNRTRKPWLRYGLLAAAAAVLVAIAIAVFDGTEESSPVDVVSEPTEPDLPAPTDEPTQQPSDFTIADASAMVDEYFAALNAGDLETVLALFVDDATFSDTNSPTLSRPDWEPRLAWDLGLGETSTSVNCSSDDTHEDQAGNLRAVAVQCAFDSQDAFSRAAGVVTPYTAVVTVTPDGISDLREDYGEPDGSDIGDPFEQWLQSNHPDVADEVYQLWGETIEESVINAERTVPYLEEWGEFLADNDCAYDEPSCGSNG